VTHLATHLRWLWRAWRARGHNPHHPPARDHAHTTTDDHTAVYHHEPWSDGLTHTHG
jgi:hypothetical protein